MEVAPQAESPLGRPASEGSNVARAHPPGSESPGPLPRPERTKSCQSGGAPKTDRSRSRRLACRRPSAQGRGPASLLRDDALHAYYPLARGGAGPRHRLGRLARSRAATHGLGLRGPAARVFGPPGSCRQGACQRGWALCCRLALRKPHDSDERTVPSAGAPRGCVPPLGGSGGGRFRRSCPRRGSRRSDRIAGAVCAAWTWRRTETLARAGSPGFRLSLS